MSFLWHIRCSHTIFFWLGDIEGLKYPIEIFFFSICFATIVCLILPSVLYIVPSSDMRLEDGTLVSDGMVTQVSIL